MFKRKWRWMLTIVVVLCFGGITFFLKSKTETQEPIKVYKAITLDPKPIPTESSPTETEVATSHSHDHNDGHNHEHFHEVEEHSETAEATRSSREYDWRDDGTFDSSSPKVDPWEQAYPEQESTDVTDDTCPPRDWYKTEDPELRAEYFYAQLLKQFGDIPEVHIIGEHTLRMVKRQSIHIDDYIEYLQALQVFWPDDKTSKLIDDVQKDKAQGVEFIFE